MLDGVSPSLLQGVGVIGFLTLTLVTLIGALWKGHLYTRPQVDEILKVQEGRVNDAKEREAKVQLLAEKWQETAQGAVGSNEANLEQSRLIISLLQAAQRSQRR